ncbi:transcriptional regulator, XRE family [Bifidobacterium longum subsp. longum]|nr:transcriptional regulator, XRE family [Bifidobacterium longum subsp. longum]
MKATLDMLAGLGLDVRVMRETPFLAVVENPAIPSRRVAVAVPDGDGPARAAMFETDPRTGRNRPHGDSAAVPRDDPWPTVAGMCRTWLAGLGALGDAAGLTRAELARRTGVAATRISEYARPRPGRADPANMTLRTAPAHWPPRARRHHRRPVRHHGDAHPGKRADGPTGGNIRSGPPGMKKGPHGTSPCGPGMRPG